ncbi:hypothetical protein [Heyndrickxia sporothermodurans]|uniref:hypothetical protein n=1 Tax=Heyndrickxia sporothermodurans TaxID=46224 RepID=UPI000D388B60|nr:hypothetical protein [Heyndrickxia sporothermodurans]PTY92992.1 hypothetical protein B5V90_02615 [Heyndrickxia sporothermodurans]
MSFLDKINAAPAAAATATAAAPKKVNPLLKKKLGGGLPKKEDAAPAAEAPKKKILPLKKKEETAQEEPKAEEKQEAAAPAETPAETKEEKKAEETKAPEKKTEEKAKPEPEAESTEEAEAPAEETAEKEAEEKPAQKKADSKKKSNSSSKANNSKKKTAAKKDNEDDADIEPTDIPTTSVSYMEAVQSITSPFVDEEWEEFKNEVQDELSAIVISDDMNPGTLKVVISELSILREKVWFSYQEQKTLYERLSSKEPEGLIERVKRVNLGKGNNDMERKKAGIMACMQYSTDAGEINLFEVLDETRTRYNFLKSVIDSIKYKTDVLITLNGALKLENQHL